MRTGYLFKMKTTKAILISFVLCFSGSSPAVSFNNSQINTTIVTLPSPDLKHGIPLNSALKTRRSHRRYSSTALSLTDLSQLLWSAQGITHLLGFRTAPSAGAKYPLEIFIVAGNVNELPPGIYHYHADSHQLERVAIGDQRKALAQAAGKQSSIAKAAVTLVISAVPRRTEKKYGPRATRYVHIEAGSAAQNIYLQAASLHLGTVFVGSFVDKEVKRIVRLPDNYEALGLMPVGHRP